MLSCFFDSIAIIYYYYFASQEEAYSTYAQIMYYTNQLLEKMSQILPHVGVTLWDDPSSINLKTRHQM